MTAALKPMLMLPRGPGPRELSPGLDHPPPDPTRSVSSLGSGAEAFPRGLLSTLAGRLLAGDQGPRVPFARVVVCSLFVRGDWFPGLRALPCFPLLSL